MIPRLVAHRMKLWWAHIFRGNKKSRGSLGWSLIGGGAFIVVAHFGAFGFFKVVEQFHPGRSSLYLPAIFGMLSALGLVPVMALTVAELYLQSDVDLLMASPLRLPSLFASKLAGLVTATAGLVGLLFVSVLTGYGRAANVSSTFYLGALVVIATLTVFLSALDMSVVMLAARIMPPKKVQALVLGLSGVLGAVLWLSVQVLSRGGGPSPRMTPGGPEPFSAPTPPQLQGLITSYAARALNALERSDVLGFLSQAGMFALFAAVMVALCFWIFRLTFYEGNARIRTSGSPGVPALGKQRIRERVAHLFPTPISGLVTKDWLSLPRDLRYLSNLIFPFVMVGYFAFNGISPSGPTPGLWGSVAPVALLSLMLGSGLVMPSVGMEGRNFNLLRSLPVSMTQLMIGKFAAFYPLVLIGSWIALVPVALYRGATPFQLAAIIAGSVWLTMGVTSLAVGVSALGANFEAQSPQRAVAPGIAFVSFFLGLLFLASNGGLIYWLIERPGARRPWIIGLMLLAAAGVTSGLVALVVLAGRRHLEKVEP